MKWGASTQWNTIRQLTGGNQVHMGQRYGDFDIKHTQDNARQAEICMSTWNKSLEEQPLTWNRLPRRRARSRPGHGGQQVLA